MWRAIKIAEQNYFFQCSVEENIINYNLYNLKEILSERCSVDDVIQRAKELNKRIFYDNETVLQTIQTATPSTVVLETDYVLVIKYHIVGRPFNFEWKLKPLPVEEFQKQVTYPLFMSIHYLSEQIKKLKDTIKKKDNEIKQYKEEGAVLKRTTVATVPFDEDTFNCSYKKVNEWSKGFLDIAEQIKPYFPLIDIGDSAIENNEKPNGSTSFIANEKLKNSPGKSKKRKYFEMRRRQMERLVKAKNETMDYQSSQSQTPPNEELAGIFQSLSDLDAQRHASTTL